MTGAADAPPSARRRLILHLGLPKTGTTTIQHFLRKNPELLARAGFLYPSPGAELTDHPAFRPTVLQPGIAKEINHAALAKEIRVRGGAQAALPVATPLWRAAFGQIDRSHAHTAIISYETFARHPRLYRFDALSEWLCAFDVRGMVYLRRQEEWAVSLYSQNVRGRDRIVKTFAQYVEILERSLYYSKVLDSIRRAIPLDSLTVIDFHKSCTEGLLEDFLSRVGLRRQNISNRGEVDSKNHSPPDWAVLFLLPCNQAKLSDEDFLEVRNVLTVLVKQNRVPALRPGLDLASPEERARLREVAEADAPRLLEDYGVAFEPRPPKPGRWRPFDADDFDEIRAAITPRLSPSARRALAAIQPPRP